MNKITWVFLGLTLTAFGMSYTQFKAHTLKYAKTLKSQALNINKRQIQNKIALRTSNPELAVEASKFNPDFLDSSYGYSIFASQKIRTDAYLDALKNKTDAQLSLSKAYGFDTQAKYMKKLEETYTEYVYQSKLLQLLKEEYTLYTKMTQIAKERYTSGSETKVAYLQAKTQALSFKTHMYTSKQQMRSLYYTLLSMGGFTKKVSLNKTFIYNISSKTKVSHKRIAKEKILLAKKRLYASTLQIDENRFSDYDVVAGIEKEPDQSILRFGVSIALPLHHNKEEEKALRKLQMHQVKLDQAQLALTIRSQKKMYKENIQALNAQYYALQTLKKEQQSLNDLLMEGYTIAQGSLLELMLAKNKLIQTKKSLLDTQKTINIQKIELRLLQGAYND